jgi:hypothetical protein
MVFLTLATILFAGGMLLVALVEIPFRRYIIATSPLLPGSILLVSVKWATRAWKTSGAKA